LWEGIWRNFWQGKLIKRERAKGQRRESNKRKLIVEKNEKIRFKDETKPK
jgi:hypothetical protein